MAHLWIYINWDYVRSHKSFCFYHESSLLEKERLKLWVASLVALRNGSFPNVLQVFRVALGHKCCSLPLCVLPCLLHIRVIYSTRVPCREGEYEVEITSHCEVEVEKAAILCALWVNAAILCTPWMFPGYRLKMRAYK